MNANFINGKMLIKSGRRIIAKIYYRPVFFKGLKVSWNQKYPYCLEINGMSAECTDFEDAISLMQTEL